MSVTVVIATYNAAATLDACLRSIVAQSVPAEIIVVDGCSQDGTLEIARRYGERIASVVSEPDRGVYDALNKGVRLASGRYIFVMGSDDVFAHPGALRDLLSAGDEDVIYGNVDVKGRDGVVRPSSTLPLTMFRYQMPFSHQGVIVAREWLLRYPFGDSLASDYRHLFQLYLAGARFRKVESRIAVFALGGMSDTYAVRSTLDRWRINRELRGRAAWDVCVFYPVEIFKCWLKPKLVRLWAAATGRRLP